MYHIWYTNRSESQVRSESTEMNVEDFIRGPSLLYAFLWWSASDVVLSIFQRPSTFRYSMSKVSYGAFLRRAVAKGELSA
jgi:hypothetical protein